MKLVLVLAAEMVPAVVLLGAKHYEKWRREQRGERPPQSTRLLIDPSDKVSLASAPLTLQMDIRASAR